MFGRQHHHQQQKSTSMRTHLLMKEVEEKDVLFVLLPSVILLFTTIWWLLSQQPRKDEHDIKNSTYTFNYLFSFSLDLEIYQLTRWKKATKTRAMISVTTMDTTNTSHHIQTRRICTQSFGILSHLCSLTLWITNDVTICMELDPGIHIDSTWLSSENWGVTVLISERWMKQWVMAGTQEGGRQNQDPRLTLKLLRQEPDHTIFLDVLEESGVQLLLQLRKLRGHPRAIHTRPWNDN
jgi:hypothetical protein